MKNFFLVIVLIAFYIKSNGQTNWCGTGDFDEFLTKTDTTYQFHKQNALYAAWNLQNDLGEHANREQTQSQILIPVVVHLIGNNVIASVNNSRIQDQIRILNEDYGHYFGTNGYGNNGVDTKVRFCLASTDEYGLPTDGILNVGGTFPAQWDHTAPSPNSNSDNTLKSLSHWNAYKYLNMYVVEDMTANRLGYSTFPWALQSSPTIDGVVIRLDVFGLTSSSNYGLGRTATHEVGHWLGLFHPFENKSSGFTESACLNNNPTWEGDRVADTPPASFNVMYPLCGTRNSCTADNLNDLVENYMEYTSDQCKNMFTQGQADRIHSGMRNSTYFKSCLEQCNNGVADGDELGIDCGGAYCPPCSEPGNGGNHGCLTIRETLSQRDADDPWNIIDLSCRTVSFLINNKKANLTAINVCKENIQLRPFNYISNQYYQWMFKANETSFLCGNTNNMGQAAKKTYTGILNNKCHCLWLSLSITIVECNASLQDIGTIFSEEKFFFDGDQSAFDELGLTSIDLNNYLPNGFQFQDGKYYRIEVASKNPIQTFFTFVFSGFVKTYNAQLNLQNQTLTSSQTADNITLDNCNVNASPAINVVAKTEIRVINESDLKSGRYFIENFDCNNISQYREINTTPSFQMANVTTQSTFLNPEKTNDFEKKLHNKDVTGNKYRISVYPNPVSDKVTIDIYSGKESEIRLHVEDMNGKEVMSASQKLQIGHVQKEILLSDFPNGVYILKITSIAGTIINVSKLVLNK